MPEWLKLATVWHRECFKGEVMAQKNRNLNLEEIDSDALFGIDALKNQTLFQKIIFWSCLIIGILINVCFPIFFEIPKMVGIICFMVFLLIGVAVGCNYTEDMTYGKYFYYFFFKPGRTLTYKSTEDVRVIRKKSLDIKREEEMILQRQRQADPAEQRKLLIKVTVFIAVIAIAVIGILLFSSFGQGQTVHHVVKGR